MDSDTAVSPVVSGERGIESMLRFVVRSMVDHPEDVVVEYVSDDEGEVFQVRANDDDLGRLIGKNGQTAKALQTIINANGRKNGRRFHLDIVGLGEALDEDVDA